MASSTSKPKLPTERESLARISESLAEIVRLLQCGLFDSGNGDSSLENIQNALFDIAEYGPGKAPAGYYDWRHNR